MKPIASMPKAAFIPTSRAFHQLAGKNQFVCLLIYWRQIIAWHRNKLQWSVWSTDTAPVCWQGESVGTRITAANPVYNAHKLTDIQYMHISQMPVQQPPWFLDCLHYNLHMYERDKLGCHLFVHYLLFWLMEFLFSE